MSKKKVIKSATVVGSGVEIEYKLKESKESAAEKLKDEFDDYGPSYSQPYDIYVNHDPRSLVDAVCQAMKKGFLPAGGMQNYYDAKMGRFVFMQAIYKLTP